MSESPELHPEPDKVSVTMLLRPRVEVSHSGSTAMIKLHKLEATQQTRMINDSQDGTTRDLKKKKSNERRSNSISLTSEVF